MPGKPPKHIRGRSFPLDFVIGIVFCAIVVVAAAARLS